MKGSTLLGFTLAGALAVTAAPASAQHRREGGERHESAPAPRGERRDENAAPRQSAPPVQQQRQEPRQEQRATPRSEQPREQRATPRAEQRPRGEYRTEAPPRYAAPRYEAPRYESPRYAAPRYSEPRYRGRYVGPRYSGPRFSYSPRRFYRPYYVFRPRFSIGFGIWAGYPVTYYDPYYYPYDYAPYATAPNGVYVTPNPSNTGGVSFDITPSDAEIWIDGNFMGVVSDYTPASQPLGLTAGRHHIELREPGYQVSAFDVDVIPGQVIPFQGQLEP